MVLDARPGSSSRLQLLVNGRSSVAFDLNQHAEVELPDLPVGTSILELQSVGEETPALRRIGLLPAAPQGAASWRAGQLAQRGNSLVQVVIPVSKRLRFSGKVRLAGKSSEEGGAAAVFLEDETGKRQSVWHWAASDRTQSAGASFEVSIHRTGFIRASFLVTGRETEASWTDLVLRLPEPASAGNGDLHTERTPAPKLVLVYVLDALRADTVGHLRNPDGATPTVDRLAREGLTFLQHRSSAPNTLPSTKTLFVGNVWRTLGGSKLDGSRETLAEVWRKAGYETGLFSGNEYVTSSYGMARGFDFEGSESLREPHFDGRGQQLNNNAEIVHAAFLDWVDSLGKENRVFAYLHVVHPHNPYSPPTPFSRRFTSGLPSEIDGSSRTLLDIRQNRRKVSKDDERRLAGLYEGNLAYADQQLGELVQSLLDRYRREDLLVVVTSDHGEELFEHGGVLHGYTLYEEQLRIPLVFWWPGFLRPNQSVSRITETADLHDTLVSLANGTGKPLLPGSTPVASRASDPCSESEPFLGEPPVHFAAASSLKGGIFSVVSPKWKLVWAPRTGEQWGMGEGRGRSRDPEYLFDRCQDPTEESNLAGSGSLEVEWLRARLLDWIEHANDGIGSDAVLSAEQERALKALGYLQ